MCRRPACCAAALLAALAIHISLFAADPPKSAAPAAPAPAPASAKKPDGNRLAYLDEVNPYYPHKDFAKLITPQWVGDEGVEAVIILSIDDMRDPARYEQFLRPILDRLKRVENTNNKAPLSIFTNAVDPNHAQLQAWLKEGLSFEVHTITHPCPCLGSGNAIVGAKPGSIEAAKQTYDGCVDLLHQIPNYKGPVAFRMPCCDSMNSVSPRFFAEVMNKTTSKGHFLSIDSSVFNVFTSADPALPRELVLEKDTRDGAAPDAKRERFAKYTQFPGFVNTIENYPYPYVIGNMIWQFPCVVPSDWEAQHLHKPNNPKTVEDLKAALDCTVIKQGVFTLVFHPHGWIKAEQVVELIDHAEKKHGKKVKFLNFAEALERINKNMIGGHALRSNKGDNQNVRVVDVNNDRLMDAVVAGEGDADGELRIWDARNAAWWVAMKFSLATLTGERLSFDHTRWGVHESSASFLLGSPKVGSTWHYMDSEFGTGFTQSTRHFDGPLIARDFDGDGECEIVELARKGSVRKWDSRPMKFALPNATLFEGELKSGVHFVDLNADQKLDIVLSLPDVVGVFLYESLDTGWSKKIILAKRADVPLEKALPPIIRADGTNNGFFVKGDALYWQNEDTGGKEPAHVKKISFAEVLALADATPQAADQSRFTTAHRVPPPPLSPQDSRQKIQVRDGFRVELVASEPLTMDPVAFDWGPDGKLWIVEMADYPDGMDGKGKPGGRVVFLEDTDNDGKYDKRTVFLDNIPFPTGVMVWKKGVLVTAAPDIFYAEDENGDGKADKRETLFTGFGEGNQQHRVNGLRWGLDGWIYLGNGDSGGNIIALRENEEKANIKPTELNQRSFSISGRDLRIMPWEWTSAQTQLRFAIASTGNFPPRWVADPQSGQTQFGRDRDDFGNWFGNNNPNPGWHYALEDHYLRRNPHIAPPNPRVDLTSDRRVFPISVVFSPSIENHKVVPGAPGSTPNHSSANSLCIYRDDLFGEQYYGNAFVSEPVHNLIRRMVLRPQGVTFKAERAKGEENREFLASSDPCFRPNMIRTGPDGCLWFADMYRQTIEHPKWIPPAWQKTLNLREGDDKGRIYRVVPLNGKPRAVARLDKLDAKGLVAAMDSPNGWQRDMAQMMLMWRDPADADLTKLKELRQDLLILQVNTPAWKKKVEELERFTKSEGVMGGLTALAHNAKNPAVRVQAIATLTALGLLIPEVLTPAAADSHPAVRVQVARIAWAYNRHAFVTGDPAVDGPGYANALLKLVGDADASVRREMAYSLGDWPAVVEYENFMVKSSAPDPRAGKALTQLLIKDAADPYITAAAMSSVLPHLDTVLKELIGPTGTIPPDQIVARAPLIEKLIGVAVAAEKLGSLASMLDVVTTPQQDKFAPWQFAALSRLLDAMARKNLSLAGLRKQADKKLAMTLDRVPQVATVAISFAVDVEQPGELRAAAVELFARLGGDDRLPTLKLVLADVRSTAALQQAAIAAIAHVGGKPAHESLLAGWRGFSPVTRLVVLDTLLKQDAGIAALLAALEQKLVGRFDIDAARRQQLLQHRDDGVRQRAEKLLGGEVATDRQKVIEEYERELAKRAGAGVPGDAARGRAGFEKNCAACHRLGDVGNPRGGLAPDLAKVADASPQGLLISILDPNRAVEAKYISYLARTKAGDAYTGIITTETGGSIAIVGVDGQERTILRSDLEELRSTGLSLMPNGLEQTLKPADVADLFAFIASHGSPAKKFANNEPRVLVQAGDGSLTLPAAAAEVRGPSLIFEQQYRNLGYWSSEQDQAVWTIEVKRAGKYEVTLDYALANANKSHAFQLLVADQRLTGPVDATGNWDTYTTKKVGTIELKPGTHRLTFRSVGPVSGALIDLRTITLK